MKFLKILNVRFKVVQGSLNQLNNLLHDHDNTARGAFLVLDCCMPSTKAILRRHVVWPEIQKE